MKHIMTFLTMIMIFTLSNIFAQHNFHDEGNYHPDSLETVSLVGTVVVDSSQTVHPFYYLDVDNDGGEDYLLNFGPYWYEPDSSDAVRPNDGETITITGGLHVEMTETIQVVVVYDINGYFWREPFEPLWNNFSGHGMHNDGGHHGGGDDDCFSYGFDWNHDTLNFVETSGTVIADTTFYYAQYYLDVNADGTPEYFLNFGPPWYEPESGVVRPEAGDEVAVKGGISDMMNYDMLVVYELNGEVWRDSSSFGVHYGGGWAHQDDTSSVRFHTPYDENDYMTIHPGWRSSGGMHGGMMMPDSVFGQMLELFPGSLPNTNGLNAFAGYQMNMLFPEEDRGMGMGSRCGGMMNFNNNVDFQFHYNEEQLNDNGIQETEVSAKYYDESTGTWLKVNGAIVNTIDNTVTFSGANVYNFIVLTGEGRVTEVESDETVAEDYQLKQNYPNPFNPSTIIEFSLKEQAKVTLSVFNMLGQEVAVLVNGQIPAGNHKVRFNANNLSTGIYIYQLKAGDFVDMKKMQLLK